MRSPKLADFLKSVSALNNHLSHTLFVFQQFKLDNQSLISLKGEQKTTVVYAANELAPQFNVKLNELEAGADLTLDYVLDTFFVFINTSFEVYLFGLQNFIKQSFDSTLPEPPDKHIYETVLENLKIDVKASFGNLIQSTFSYYKLRRNATMHRDRKKRCHGTIEDLIKGNKNKNLDPDQLNGYELNIQWQSYAQQNIKGHAVRNTDFSDTNFERFSLPELIDVFNFYRLIAELIDQTALEKQGRADVLKYCCAFYKDFFGELEGLTFETFAPKFLHICKLQLNLVPEAKEVEASYKTGI